MNYAFESENGIMTVKLEGEMDHHNAKRVREEIDARIAVESPVKLRLDLSDINFCDSSGLGFIMGRFRRMQEAGGTIALINPSYPTMKILHLAGVDKLITTEYSKGVSL